jgi:hypothetical protein
MTVTTMAPEPAALEQLITQVRGVHAVRLVADQSGQIDEVHVVGDPGRTPKAIVRDIESILYVRGGVRVDHRKISLVQVPEAVVHPQPPRLQIVAVCADNDGERPAVTVTLRLRTREVRGMRVCEAGRPADLPLLAARATIEALTAMLGAGVDLALEQLHRQSLGSLEVYLAHLSRDEDGVAEALLGVSVVRGDELLAVTRAVLDAVNRRLERLLPLMTQG